MDVRKSLASLGDTTSLLDHPRQNENQPKHVHLMGLEPRAPLTGRPTRSSYSTCCHCRAAALSGLCGPGGAMGSMW